MVDPPVDEWLSLSEASALLGVHASTLRRWADSGRIPSQRTPGGHRRFNRRRLRPFVDGGIGAPAAAAEPGDASEQLWHARFAGADLIAEFRELGQRLSGILIQYLMRPDADRRYLGEGHALGRTYAAHSRAVGISLLDAVRAFLYYRTSFSDMVTQMPAQDLTALQRLYTRYDQFMSEVLLGLIAGYEPADAP
jgi:excisionase family DNA binding protein